MTIASDPETQIDWHRYNLSAAGRPARRFVARAIAGAGGGPGRGRTVLDLGAGGGSDALEFARRGFMVLAYDSDDALAARLVENGRMDGTLLFHHGDLADVEVFPPADLVFSGYALPMLGTDLPVVWERVRSALKPGGILAVDLFGDRDTWAERPDIATLSALEIEGMLEGFEVIEHDVRDEDGRSYADGKKHWHVHSIIARRVA